MRLIDRYICREVVSHALLGLVVFTFVFFVPRLVQLMDLVVRHSGGAGTVTLLFLCTLPPALAFTLPMAVLVGVLIGLGRMSADSEIVALHAAGVGLRRLLVPIGFVAMAGTLITLATTFWLSPAALRTLRSLEDKLLSSQASFSVQPRVFDERFPHVVLYVQDVEAAATRWHGVFLATVGVVGFRPAGDSQAGSNEFSVTTAENAFIMSGPSEGQIQLHLGRGSTHSYDPRYPKRYNVTTFGENDIPVDISAATTAAKNTPLSTAERSNSVLLTDKGPNWRESRIEFQRRIAVPAACLIFALLGVPVGVRPRRGGRAAGLILALVLIGGYYFIFVYGIHMAELGRVSPWLGVWAADVATAVVGVFFLSRIENIRKPNLLVAWAEALWLKRTGKAEAPNGNGRAAIMGPGIGATPVSNGPIALASLKTAALIRGEERPTSTMAFPMLIDVYLFEQFSYYLVVLLAGFVLIFDAFTLFDLLGDITRNHIGVLTVLNYFRYLVPLMVYQLAPLATLVATLVTLAILAKNNEVIALKASGISMYRLVLPLLLCSTLVAGGMFLLDDTFLPYANQRQDALRDRIKGKPAQTYLQPARQWIFGEHSKIYNYELFDSDRQLFGGLNVFELDPTTFQIRRRIYAARATWEPSESIWVLTGGWVRDFDADGQVTRYDPFTATSLPELTEPPNYFRREVRQYYQMNWRQLGEYIASLRQAGFDTARLSVQWEKKFAFPLIATIIVFLSAPFAFLTGTRGAIGGVAVAVGIGVVYWATAALFEAMGSVGQLPPLLAGWAPDAIFGFLGVYFFLRMPT
ncbi:MAG TPA: LptF/LptG family permease [Candidatus Acidoferrales bacterium]|jgi:LPS export ABC transporter permease LptF/LPS export ABC transporter permease LptG|nr:LptF/LptG family permease [Candidatus Acidoferrales bacterium]